MIALWALWPRNLHVGQSVSCACALLWTINCTGRGARGIGSCLEARKCRWVVRVLGDWEKLHEEERTKRKETKARTYTLIEGEPGTDDVIDEAW